jgi:hypothetical protein
MRPRASRSRSATRAGSELLQPLQRRARLLQQPVLLSLRREALDLAVDGAEIDAQGLEPRARLRRLILKCLLFR